MWSININVCIRQGTYSMARTLPFTNLNKFEYDSAVRGYHVYMTKNKWNPLKGTKFHVEQEPDNECDSYACAVIVENGKIVGHLPYEISHNCFHFLSHEGKITGVTTGKRRRNNNSCTGGLEIPSLLTFSGEKRLIKKLPVVLKKKRIPPPSW